MRVLPSDRHSEPAAAPAQKAGETKWRSGGAAMRSVAAIGIAALALLAVVGALVATPAMAAGQPEWNVLSLTNPTHLAPNSPRDEVQEVTVSATGGTFTLSRFYSHKLETTALLPYDASAAEVQSALEKFSNFPGKVTVTGAGAGEISPYTVTFSGQYLKERPEEVMTANSSGLSGGSAEANVREVTRGEFAPEIRAVATNVGGALTNGSAITLSDTLPAGVVATSVTGYDTYAYGGIELPIEVTCASLPTVSCTYDGTMLPGDMFVVKVTLKVEAGSAEELVNHVSVSGGGAASATAEAPLTVSDTPAGFGPEPGSVMAAVSSHQAGAHPNVTTAFAMNLGEKGVPAGNPKDIRFDLPPGLVGQAAGMPRCTMAAVEEQNTEPDACPRDTMVGMATVQLVVFLGRSEPGEEAYEFVTPIYNIAPAPGEPVAFGFLAVELPVRLDTSVLSNGSYGVRVTAPGLSEAAGILSSWITIWGVPAEYNGEGTDLSDYKTFGGSGAASGESVVPLLTNPQQCSTPLSATMEADSWQNAGAFVDSESLPMGTLTGCEQLRFEPSFTMLPDTLEAGAPAGYAFNLDVPQRNEVETLATPTVEDVKLTLPLGTVVNPSAAWGLKACSNAQFYGSNHPSQEPASPAQCPREAQVGKVSIKTPALEEALEGQVYLAEPECDPCTPQDAENGKMVRLFLNVVGTGEAGIVVKLEGYGTINQATGQITTVFEEDPQLPFSEFKLALTGGSRAVLANPRTCGPVSSNLDMASWDGALPEASLSDGFEVSQNCFGAQFAPSFKAGMPNIQAGAHGEFTLAFGREDDDQFLKQITLHMPPGLLGDLTGVELCKEAQANAGDCGGNSLLGSAQVLTGPGANPFLVEGGKVYLTEGYGGAPYGLSIVVPAVAGPYTLSGTTGNGTVVVRSQIFVDEHTAQLTVVSGELPSMLDGIPLQLKAVNVKIDRPGFTFNPTSCEKMAVSGTIASQEGMSANVSAPFQVTNCAALPFKPVLKASTKAKHTRKGGAYLQVSVSSGEGQANIAKAKVELPKKLPSRLSTLQQACTESQFNANPAGCPAASQVGSVVVHTPVLPVPLTGPAYFVSRGAQWPELIMVLQGYGVTVDLAGETHISKGVTSTTLGSVPDVPFTSFTLTLSEGPHSALAGNGNLCKESLIMPTKLTGQNGALVEKQTTVKVSGCAAARKKTKKGGKRHGKSKHAERKGAKQRKGKTQTRAGR